MLIYVYPAHRSWVVLAEDLLDGKGNLCFHLVTPPRRTGLIDGILVFRLARRLFFLHTNP